VRRIPAFLSQASSEESASWKRNMSSHFRRNTYVSGKSCHHGSNSPLLLVGNGDAGLRRPLTPLLLARVEALDTLGLVNVGLRGRNNAGGAAGVGEPDQEQRKW